MNTGKSISMDLRTWTDIDKVAIAEFHGVVAAATEALCKEALIARDIATIERRVENLPAED